MWKLRACNNLTRFFRLLSKLDLSSQGVTFCMRAQHGILCTCGHGAHLVELPWVMLTCTCRALCVEEACPISVYDGAFFAVQIHAFGHKIFLHVGLVSIIFLIIAGLVDFCQHGSSDVVHENMLDFPPMQLRVPRHARCDM